MIVGLTGFAGSGKDTVAEILVQEHGFKRYAFADKLREMAYALDPTVFDPNWMTHRPLTDVVDVHGWDFAKREMPEVRELLQRLGVWHRENVSEDFWVELLWEQISQGFFNEYGEYRGWDEANIVITDVRFANEARWVREYDGELWRVTRPGVGPVNDHISEKLDLAADNTVLNNGSLLHLRELVWAAIKGEEQAA